MTADEQRAIRVGLPALQGTGLPGTNVTFVVLHWIHLSACSETCAEGHDMILDAEEARDLADAALVRWKEGPLADRHANKTMVDPGVLVCWTNHGDGTPDSEGLSDTGPYLHIDWTPFLDEVEETAPCAEIWLEDEKQVQQLADALRLGAIWLADEATADKAGAAFRAAGFDVETL